MASHSSNVPVSQALAESFRQVLQTGNKRFIKVQVQMEPTEQLVEVGSQPARGTFEDDFALVPPVLEAKNSAYIIYRTDRQGATGYEFILLSYVPDGCKAREKMMYSSSTCFKTTIRSK